MMAPLFSAVILCYRHFEHLFAAIDSVLQQDYPNIELIVSDDGSDEFPKEKVEKYIQKNRRKNITSVVVRQEQENGGTVRHLNHAIEACSGEFVVAVAGDDMLFDDKVLSAYVAGFAKAPKNCYIEMAQTAMFDENLKELEGYYLKVPVRQAIEKTTTDSKELLQLLIRHGACLPSTSTCFKKEFFKKFGCFNEEYVLVEDYPMHYRLAVEGWIIHYENFVAIKHRHGGISHGQKGATSRSAVLYYRDLKRCIETIIIPNLSCLPEEEQRQLLVFQKKQLRWIAIFLAKVEKKKLQLLLLGFKYPCYAAKMVIQKLWPFAQQMHVRLLLACLASWFFTPTIGGIMATITVTNISAQIQSILYIVTAVAFWVWVFTFFVWAINLIIWKLQRCPNEAFAIG